jgi:glycine hydroxymethyltransferase
LAALGSVLQNKTAEGFVNRRFHGGCSVINEVEALAIERAKQLFGAKYANVQPHSGSSANHIVYKTLLKPGDVILSLDARFGGHPSHGGCGSATESTFKVETYGVERDGFIFDYEKIRQKALAVRPKLIICGASIHPNTMDFARFRAIADEVGAYLLADVSHLTSLIIAGVHPSPIDIAHITTTSTYKAGGPRGGLILSGKDFQMAVNGKSLADALDAATFPGVQGTPYFNNITAKAVFFAEAMTNQYKARQVKVVENSKRLAEALLRRGFDVIGRGTDNHMMIVDVGGFRANLSSPIAQQALEKCNIVVDSFRLGFENQDEPNKGVRLGTPIVTRRGMGTKQMDMAAEMIAQVLEELQINSKDNWKLDEATEIKIIKMVSEMCEAFAIP